MYALVSVVLLGAAIYLHNDGIFSVGCLIASGLFAIASAIDGLMLTVESDEETKK